MLNQDASQKNSFKQSAFLSMKLILVADILLISGKKERLLFGFCFVLGFCFM